MIQQRKLIIYIAMSVDGYIAKPNGDISFLSLAEQNNEDYGYSEFVKSIDIVIVGRKTFESVLKMGYEYPHKDKDVYIITRTPQKNTGNLKYYSGDLHELVTKLKKEYGKHIYCDGGSEIVNELMKHDLVDELIVSVIPVVLGDGIPLFANGIKEKTLRLLGVKQYTTGLVQLHYAVNGAIDSVE